MKNGILSTALLIGSFTMGSAMASGNSPMNRGGELPQKKTLDLCVEYSTLANDEQRQAYFKELEIRGQLSVKDHKLVSQGKVENSMTMCGMYMAKGKPMAEQSRQIRPMTFKTVHVYQDMYLVTQSGMVVATYERKPGALPPELEVAAPEVEPSPTLKHH